MTPATFLTGATGFVGATLLAELLHRADRPVIALARGRDDHAARQRVLAALAAVHGAAWSPQPGTLKVVAGDLEHPQLGLDHRALDRVATIDTVVHCGASIRFDLPLHQARAVNVSGTRAVLDLAARAQRHTGAPPHLVHVSTAYVSGRHTGVFAEDDLDPHADFRNTYEQTKAEAEALVRASGQPAVIARPSIVVGEAHSGWTSAFNVLYWPLRAYARGLLDHLPADPDGLIDAIGVDAVVAGLLALHDDRTARGTHTLAAGPAAVTTTEMATAAASLLDRPTPRFVRLSDTGPLTDRAGDSAAVYLPYFDVHTRFATARGHDLLQRAGHAVPPLTAMLPALLRFAHSARWGKTAIPRATARAIAA